MPKTREKAVVVSIVIGSVRHHQTVKCLESIHRYTKDIPYEVVLIAPFDIEPHPNVVYVRESNPRGYYWAISDAFEQASGEYIIHIADDCRATPLWAKNMINYMKLHDGEIFEGSYRHFDVKGERAPQGHYGKLIAPFICIRKDVARQIGGLMDTYYTSFCGDPDLAMRVWHNGGSVGTCPDAWIYHCDDDDEQFFKRRKKYGAKDVQAFLARWYELYRRPGDVHTGREQPLPGHPALFGLPPEICTRLYHAVINRNWHKIKGIIAAAKKNEMPVYPEGFDALYKLLKTTSRRTIFHRKELNAISSWLLENGFDMALYALKSKSTISLRERIWRYLIVVPSAIATKMKIMGTISKLLPKSLKQRLLPPSMRDSA